MMTKDDDTAALVAEARKYVRENGAGYAGVLLTRLAAALEAATADRARLREALELIAEMSEAEIKARGLHLSDAVTVKAREKSAIFSLIHMPGSIARAALGDTP